MTRGSTTTASSCEAQNVWLGKLKVDSVCFSYIPVRRAVHGPVRHADVRRTPPRPAATSRSSSATPTRPRTAGTPARTSSCRAVLSSGRSAALRTGRSPSSADPSATSAGGSRSPMACISTMSRSGCVSVRRRSRSGPTSAPTSWGTATSSAVDGGFTYTDATETSPWSLELDGSLTVGDTPIGSGTLGINGAGGIDFGLQAGVDVLDGAASLNAQVSGWIDAPHNQFVVSGSGQGCLGSACATASGELSSTGVAGCVTVGTSTPTYDLIIPLDGSAPHLDTSTYPLTAGFGYVWGASTVDLLGGSCDFSPYEPTQAAADRAAASECATSPADRSRHGCRFAAHPRDPWAAEGRPPRTARRDDHLAVARPRDAAQGPLPARREQDEWDDQRDAGPSGRGNLDREPGSGLRLVADED